jgi:hypothetical protein
MWRPLIELNRFPGISQRNGRAYTGESTEANNVMSEM